MTESGERTPEIAVEKSQGEIWLEIIGYGHRKDEIMVLSDGREVPARNFHEDEKCMKYAGPMFRGIEYMSIDPHRDEAEFAEGCAAARKAADMWLGPDPLSQEV